MLIAVTGMCNRVAIPIFIQAEMTIAEYLLCDTSLITEIRADNGIEIHYGNYIPDWGKYNCEFLKNFYGNTMKEY